MEMGSYVESLKNIGFFVIEHWKKSTDLFNFKSWLTLVKISINACYKVIQLLFTTCWYVLICMIVPIVLLAYDQKILAGIVLFLLCYLLVLLLRPSVRRKKIGYLGQYMQHVWGVVIVVFTTLAIFIKLPELLLYWINISIAPWLFWLLICIALPPTMFSGFLFIDTELDLFQSWYKGLLIFLLTLPFSLTTTVILFFPLGFFFCWIKQFLILFVPYSIIISTVLILGAMLLFLAQTAWLNTIYLKHIYKNIELYI